MSICMPCAEYGCGNVVVDGKFCPMHEKERSPTFLARRTTRLEETTTRFECAM